MRVGILSPCCPPIRLSTFLQVRLGCCRGRPLVFFRCTAVYIRDNPRTWRPQLLSRVCCASCFCAEPFILYLRQNLGRSFASAKLPVPRATICYIWTLFVGCMSFLCTGPFLSYIATNCATSSVYLSVLRTPVSYIRHICCDVL